MLRVLSFLLILITFVNAADKANTAGKVEIFATKMDSKDNIVTASNGVTVIYKDYYLSANRAVYNRITSDLELFDNVRVTTSNKYKLLGDYAKLNISKKQREFKPFFMLDKTNGLWISANKGCGSNNDIDITSGVVSGCDPNDPLWKMEFSSSSYNTETKWLNLYNARIYIYDIPVMYTPYFGYPLDTTRRTGLLIPSFGLSSDEGFYYKQPIFIAEQNWWDVELSPQTRTNRGSGIYATLRFVDTKSSKGTLTTGYFKERDSYFKKNNLAHDKHYGFNFKYNNTDFINQLFDLNLDGQSGIYADINNMNDVDYINLASNDNIDESTTTLILSRVNLFYNTDKNYFGTYFKYYKDLTKQSNEDTLQKLPTFQYHHYLETLFKDHLLYNVDLKTSYIHRDINKKAVQTDLNIPVTLHTSLFDEYLNLSYESRLYAQHSSFSGNEKIRTGEYEDGYFARNYNIIEINTQLTKAYSEFTHVIGFGSRYTFDGSESEDGYYEENMDFCSKTENKDDSRCDFYNISEVEEQIELDFSQYIFDIGGKQLLYHRLSQALSYENSSDKFGELENELDFQITKSINFYNNMFYNHNERKFSKIFNKISYKNSSFNVVVSHMYKDTFLAKTSTYTPYTSYITSSVSYTYNEHYTYHANWNYDLEANDSKTREIGFIYKKRCWDFGITYIENNKPVLTQNSSSSSYDKYIYFTIALKPLMPSTGSPVFEHKISQD